MLRKSGNSARYIDSLRNRNYSPNTIYSRGRAIIRFQRAMGIDPLEATEDQMIGWWTNLRLSPSSRAGELAAIRGYCRFAVKHRLIEADPTRLLDRPKLPRRVPRPIDEVALGLALTHALPDVLAILCLAAFCGLRAAEIAALEWSDIRKDTLLIHGKGDKERVVPLHLAAKAALDGLPGKRRGPVLRRRDYKGGSVPPHLISQWANRHLHSLGITETLHQLRHRFGTLTYQLSHGDIRMVQDLLGHASPVTTAGYSAWDQSRASLVTRLLPSPGV